MRVIFMHGKDKTPNDIWYPWLKTELTKAGITCDIPDFPRREMPQINEWLGVLDSLRPDAETVLVGHSRGGMAILRWLETRQKPVAKVVLAAANSATIEDPAKGDFYSGPYNFAAIRQYCQDFVVLHSRDDPWVPYTGAIENAQGLGAKLMTFEGRAHFGAQPDGSVMMTFPELLDAIMPRQGA